MDLARRQIERHPAERPARAERLGDALAPRATAPFTARREHPGPFQGPEHPEGARLVRAEDPVHLAAEPRHQALRLLLCGVGGRAGVLGVGEVCELGELLRHRLGEPLLALLGAGRADHVPEQDDLALALEDLPRAVRAARTPPL